jgi:hypothetical protein
MPEYLDPVLTPEDVASSNVLPVPRGYDAVPDLQAGAAQRQHDNPIPTPFGYDAVPKLSSSNFVPERAPYATPHPAADASLGVSAGPPPPGPSYDYAQPKDALSGAAYGYGAYSKPADALSGAAYAYAQPKDLLSSAADGYAKPKLGQGKSGNMYSRPKDLANPAAPIGNPAAPINAAASAPAAPPVAPAHAMPRLELGTANPDQGIVDATRNQMFPKTAGSQFRTKGMADSDSHYQHEAHTASFRGKGPMGNVFTKYWNDAEQDAHKLGADKASGTLGFLNSGQQMNTIGATGQGTWNGEGKDKYIYTMDGAGAMRAVDPADKNEWARKDMPGLAAPATTNADKQVGLVNHSSTVRGKDVAAAGDMTVRDGRLETLSNVSGHYRPDVGMLHQAAHMIGTKGAMRNDTTIDMERGPEGRMQTNALQFLGASQGQEEIARDAFGTKKASDQVAETAGHKADLMSELRRRVPKID